MSVSGVLLPGIQDITEVVINTETPIALSNKPLCMVILNILLSYMIYPVILINFTNIFSTNIEHLTEWRGNHPRPKIRK